MKKPKQSKVLKSIVFLSYGIISVSILFVGWLIYKELSYSKPRTLNGFVVNVDRGIIDSMWVRLPYTDSSRNPDGSWRIEVFDTNYWMRLEDTTTHRWQDWTVHPSMFEIYSKGDYMVMGDSAAYYQYLERLKRDAGRFEDQ